MGKALLIILLIYLILKLWSLLARLTYKQFLGWLLMVIFSVLLSIGLLMIHWSAGIILGLAVVVVHVIHSIYEEHKKYKKYKNK